MKADALFPYLRPVSLLAAGLLLATAAITIFPGLVGMEPRAASLDQPAPVSAKAADVVAKPRGADRANAAVRPPAPPDAAPLDDDLVIVAPEGRVPLPVAFQSLKNDAAMPPEQRERLNSIQEEFIEAIGGVDQDPSSLAYKNKWREAQRLCDQKFQAAFGQVAFLRRQMATVRADR